MDDGGWERSVPAQDAFGRSVSPATGESYRLRTFVPTPGLVGVHAPPSGVALLPALDVPVFRDHLAAAVIESSAHADRSTSTTLGFRRQRMVADVHGDERPARIDVSAGSVSMSGPHWYLLDPDAVDALADDLRAAAVVARQQALVLRQPRS